MFQLHPLILYILYIYHISRLNGFAKPTCHTCAGTARLYLKNFLKILPYQWRPLTFVWTDSAKCRQMVPWLNGQIKRLLSNFYYLIGLLRFIELKKLPDGKIYVILPEMLLEFITREISQLVS